MATDDLALQRLEDKLDKVFTVISELDRKWTERIVPLELNVGDHSEYKHQQTLASIEMQRAIGGLDGRLTVIEERSNVTMAARTALQAEVNTLRDKVSDLEKARWQLIGIAGGVSAFVGLVIQLLALRVP